MNPKKPLKIGVLGSACNPPHKEHAAIGEYAARALCLDRLIVMPTGNPPHKNAPDASPKTRLEMARIMAKKRGWEVSDTEVKQRGKSYTADTIAKLKKKYPDAELFWIVGSDSIVLMPQQWKSGYDVLDLCKFVVAKRRGYSLRRVPAHARKKIIILKRRARDGFSSTEARAALARNDIKKASLMLEPEILNFIIQHKLYQ